MKLKHGPLPVLGRTILTTIIVGIGMLGYWSVSHALPTPAGTVISNQARAEYTAGTQTFEVFSNTVETVVQPVGALDLQQSQTKDVASGNSVNFPHILTNTGNVPDKFVISAVPTDGTVFDTVVMYNDTDCDGIVDTPPVQFTGLTPEIPVAGQFCFIVTGVTKSGLTGTPSENITVQADGVDYTTSTGTNTDTATITENGALSVTKSQSHTSGGPGTEITYTLTYVNSGGANVTNILLYDAIPTGTTYVTDSGNINGTATPDSDANWTYTAAGTANVTVAIAGPVLPNATGYISFKVKVNTDATGTINNTPFFCYNNSTDVVPSASPGDCDSDSNGTPDASAIAANHETGNTVNFSVLLDFLQKYQALDTNCDGTIEGAYTTSQLTTGAGPGACIRYKIVATNKTGGTVTSVMIYDQTPAYTVFDDGSRNSAGGACGGTADADAQTSIGGTRAGGQITAPTCGGTGPVNASLGSIPNNTSVDFTFGVMIQ